MKYKVGDWVYSLQWAGDMFEPPRAQIVKHKIRELVEGFPSAPYWCHTGQFHGKSVSKSKNEMRERAIRYLEKEIQKLRGDIENEKISDSV